MAWAVALAAVLLGTTACQNQTHAVFSPAPSPSPRVEPAAAVLQASDVPAGLSICLGSGPIDVYLAGLAQTDPTLASQESAMWQQLRDLGADAGAISIFTSLPSACDSELGTTRNAKTAASFVARFADANEADRAWQQGVFGFAPPAPGEVSPGLTRGTSTGFGLSSFVFVQGQTALASWRHGEFVALVVLANLDPATLKAAAAAVDARLD